MTAARTCPQCGTEISTRAMEGLCPKCVGRAAFDETGVEGERSALAAEMLEAELARLKPEEAGERIGPYKLLQNIGEGGFGVVWMAEQERQVRRRVALKIIKLGMDTKEVIARFEQERQALAMMDHPNIAKVFDAGATQWGRPFFVMELVRGIRITDYCDEANLPTAERLQLFILVCQAIQHAHQKGIIHRDIKPSNILVTLHDGVPVPKVIDFGVAKATQSQRLTDLTLFTQFEQMIGTPLYMSPEQAEMSGLDIDTRTDIYSLGVLLYELLTGRTPFDPAELMRKGYDEIRRTIREEEPQTPSNFLNTMAAETRATVAQHRQSDPAKLAKAVRGDLDWIVMKALEKDRTRRYETANGLAKDIERHLANEPVTARPASPLYRFRRLVRRNRVVFAAAGAVVAALVIGLTAAIHSFLNERTARAGEAKQREIAEDQSRQARASAVAAQTSAGNATASELKARRFLYAADMNLAQQALRANNVGRARLLLDRHRPTSGELDLRGWEWRHLWQECRSGAQAMLTKREGLPVFSTSFSPDGTQLLAGYFDGQVELWDLAGGKLQQVVQPPCDLRAHVAFSPRGESFAATMGKGILKSVNLKTRAETVLCQTSGFIRDVSYSRDGEWLAVVTGGSDMALVVQVNDGASVLSYPLPPGGGMLFNNARISPDKQRLYVSCGAFEQPNVRCVSIPDGRLLWEDPLGMLEAADPDSKSDIGFSAMDLSPDGRTLVVATGYGYRQIHVLDAETGQSIKKLTGHMGYVLQVAFSKDGRLLASTSDDQTIRLWDPATWTKLGAPLRGHNHEVNAVAVSDDRRMVASGNKDGEVLLWDAQLPRLANGRRALPAHIQGVIALPVGRMVLGRTVDDTWSLIDLLTLAEEPLPAAEIPAPGQYPALVPMDRRRTPKRLDPAQLGLRGLLGAYATSFDGKLLAVASDSGEIGLYDAVTMAKIDIVRSNMGSACGVAFSPDNQRIVLAGGGENGVALWDTVTRQELLTLSSPDGLLYDVAFTDDGNTLLAGSQRLGKYNAGSCQFWQAPSWKEIEDAERVSGRWPQTVSPKVPPPPPTYAETKILLEQGYREKLDAPGARSPENLLLWDGNLANLANVLRGQNREAEIEPLLRAHLETLRRRIPRDDEAIYTAAANLLSVSLALLRTEPATAEPEKLAIRAQQADALADEMLALTVQSALATPLDTLPSLKVAALQVWFEKNAGYLATCRRLIELAEKKSDDPFIGERASKAWCLKPSSDPALLARALHFARHSAVEEPMNSQRGWYQQTLGMAEYRSGNEEAAEQAMIRAVESFEQSTNWNPEIRPFVEGPARLFRAMILFHRREVAEARKLFSQAEAQMKPLPIDPREVLSNGATQDDLLFWLTYKEAKALLQSGPAR